MNSFAKYPDIATLWSDQNELTADEVRPNHRSGAWTCPTCHNDYNAEIIDMVNGNADCPYCSGRKAIPGKTSFAALHPDLMNGIGLTIMYQLILMRLQKNIQLTSGGFASVILITSMN